jgi:TonB family protein
MFNNLIESSSHTKEYKRRGSFLLFTGATYLVLFAIAGVASIYAYDAHLEQQAAELELLSWVPQPPPESPPEVVRNAPRPSATTAANTTHATRILLIDSTSNPLNPPPHAGATASTIPPAPRGAVIGPENLDPIGPPAGNRTGTGTGNTPVAIDMADPPPSLPAPTPKPAVPSILKVSRVLNSQALSLPKPNYPPLARNIRLQGSVIVQVLIDEGGKVLSAKVTSGHPLFAAEAQRAAMQARFSPTLIGDKPVKVSGVITYKFELNN